MLLLKRNLNQFVEVWNFVQVQCFLTGCSGQLMLSINYGQAVERLWDSSSDLAEKAESSSKQKRKAPLPKFKEDWGLQLWTYASSQPKRPMHLVPCEQLLAQLKLSRGKKLKMTSTAFLNLLLSKSSSSTERLRRSRQKKRAHTYQISEIYDLSS